MIEKSIYKSDDDRLWKTKEKKAVCDKTDRREKMMVIVFEWLQDNRGSRQKALIAWWKRSAWHTHIAGGKRWEERKMVLEFFERQWAKTFVWHEMTIWHAFLRALSAVSLLRPVVGSKSCRATRTATISIKMTNFKYKFFRSQSSHTIRVRIRLSSLKVAHQTVLRFFFRRPSHFHSLNQCSTVCRRSNGD